MSYSRLNELPDPPENPEFAELPEAFQDKLAQRFDVGVRLTEQRDKKAYYTARSAWQNWVLRCHLNRVRERKDRAQREAILEQNRRRVR